MNKQGNEESATEIVELSTPSVVRSEVKAGRPYATYRETLRFDFWFSCAYCSIAEIEATGLAFEIDHYKPQKTGDSDVNEYSNLMWACDSCNGKKTDLWETDANREKGHRFLRPDEDDLSKAYKLIGVRLVPLTNPAEYTEQVLFLNSQRLRNLRQLRQDIKSSQAAIVEGLQALRRLKIDQAKPAFRQRLAETKSALAGQAKSLLDGHQIDDIVRLLNHADFVDPDPEQPSNVKRRREFLRSINQIGS